VWIIYKIFQLPILSVLTTLFNLFSFLKIIFKSNQFVTLFVWHTILEVPKSKISFNTTSQLNCFWLEWWVFLNELISLLNGFNMRHLLLFFLSEEKVSLPNFARFAQVQSGNTFAANALSLRCTFFGRLLKAAWSETKRGAEWSGTLAYHISKG